MEIQEKFKACAGVLLLSAFLPGNAVATLLLDTGLVGGSGDVQNVLLTQPGDLDNVVVGELNQSHDLVNFTSNEDIIVAGGGQARIEAVDGSFEMIMWELDDPTLGFSKVQFNIDAGEDGFADIFLLDQFGTTFSFLNQALDANGQNFFTGYSLDNQVIVKATINSSVAMTGINDLQQVRLGPVSIDDGSGPPQEIPEPTMVGLLGLGMLGMGLSRLRRKRKVS